MKSITVEKVDIRAAAVTTAKVVAIALSFAVLYVLMTTYSPVLAKSSMAGMLFGKTLRLANALRAFALVTPLAAIGTGVGGIWMDMTSAAPNVWNSVFNTTWGLGVYAASRRWGGSRLVDMSLLAGFGVLSGLTVSITNGSMFLLAGGQADGTFMSLVGFKVVSSVIIYMSGYALVEGYRYVSRTR